MAIVGSVIGSFDPADASITLTRGDLFDGATPTAAIITVVQNMQGTDGYNANLTGIGRGVGAITSSTQWSCGASLENGTANQEAYRRQQNGTVVSIPAYATGVSSFTALMTGSLVADGITLTKSGTWVSEGGSGDVFIEVTLLGGDDFSAWIPSGSFVTSQTRVGGIPFRPNMGFFAGIGASDTGDSQSFHFLSQGWVFDNGVAAHNECARISLAKPASTEGDSRVEMLSANFYSTMTGVGALLDTASHTDFDTDGGNFEHNYTTSNANDFTFCPLYMRFDNEDCSVGQLTLPSSTGTFSSTGYGHDPAVAKVIGNSRIEAYDTNYGGTASGNDFDWTIEGSGSSISTFNKEAAITITCRTRLSLSACYSIGETDSDGFRSYAPQRITDGFSMEMTQIALHAKPSFVVTLGTPAEGGLNLALGSSSSSKAYLGSTEVTAAYLGSQNLGGVSGWRTLYSDPDPASDASVWRGTNSTITSVTDGLEVTHIATGFAFTIFDSTVVVPGKDYRVTIVTGSGDGAPSLALQDGAGTNLSAAGVDCPPNSTTQVTTKALDSGLQLLLLSSLNAGEKYLMESVLIEEMV